MRSELPHWYKSLLVMCGELVLMQYVIYRHPDDHPRGWVVRAWGIVRGQREPVTP
jgi:hypothetical protein